MGGLYSSLHEKFQEQRELDGQAASGQKEQDSDSLSTPSRHEELKMTLGKKRILRLDPRSPSEGIDRTPIVVDKTPKPVPHENRTCEKSCIEDTPKGAGYTSQALLLDPRSPTTAFTRTPINPSLNPPSKAGNFPAIGPIVFPDSPTSASSYQTSESGIESGEVSPVSARLHQALVHTLPASPDSALSEEAESQPVDCHAGVILGTESNEVSLGEEITLRSHQLTDVAQNYGTFQCTTDITSASLLAIPSPTLLKESDDDEGETLPPVGEAVEEEVVREDNSSDTKVPPNSTTEGEEDDDAQCAIKRSSLSKIPVLSASSSSNPDTTRRRTKKTVADKILASSNTSGLPRSPLSRVCNSRAHNLAPKSQIGGTLALKNNTSALNKSNDIAFQMNNDKENAYVH